MVDRKGLVVGNRLTAHEERSQNEIQQQQSCRENNCLKANIVVKPMLQNSVDKLCLMPDYYLSHLFLITGLEAHAVHTWRVKVRVLKVMGCKSSLSSVSSKDSAFLHTYSLCSEGWIIVMLFYWEYFYLCLLK